MISAAIGPLVLSIGLTWSTVNNAGLNLSPALGPLWASLVSVAAFLAIAQWSVLAGSLTGLSVLGAIVLVERSW
jgi:hypothetical protein